MNLVTRDRVNTYTMQFLITELRVGMTFATMAVQASGDKKQRYVDNARAAYHAVVRHGARAKLSSEDAGQIEVLTARLCDVLRALGGTVL